MAGFIQDPQQVKKPGISTEETLLAQPSLFPTSFTCSSISNTRSRAEYGYRELLYYFIFKIQTLSRICC
jgi:hypothetical protein